MIILKIVFLFLAVSISASNKSNPEKAVFNIGDSVQVETDVDLPVLSKTTPFQNGEVLSFRIRYGFITAGSAKMKVFTKMYDDTTQVFHLQTTAKSASGFSWIYKVDDVVNSYVDFDDFYPIRFEKKLREGSYLADLFTDYHPLDSLAKVETIRYTSDMEVRKRKKYDVAVPPYCQDILSSFYYIRRFDLKVGESLFLTNHEKKKVYDLEVLVHKKEVIEVEAGKFRCIVVEPIIKGEGLFKKKGRLKVWLTDDDKKIPIQMKSEVLVGNITTELTKIKGVKDKIEAKIK
ncbi:MAG: DUF3108 domain-containing protein [Calditrichaeota bacterium]|nr:MAG: DUF3108 domain-containing protein [Calditrichota bacterium]MBL1204518.1 DUF3108 domain-containing protein [Calditrichota bacterium]NOG44346.1 DUF3108 domain-containing protein [Calditrichota bacterium]